MRLTRTAVATAAAAAAVVATITAAPPASAATSYVHNDCTSTDTSHPTHCFRIQFNSRSETTQQSDSGCLATRHSRSNDDGYSPNGASFITFVFGAFPSDAYGGMPTPCDARGSGQGVYHHAASAWNQDPYAGYTVYANTGYSGTSKYYPKADGIARNLSSGLKNHNGSHKRS
ncbi:hypothetical protein [Streptomyces hokutonensis]|uniref:Uncharacterized protein n=1 Tax=Streptomyces hokutonensis TaxID=1306990 RepID=A0ABW6MJ02_9ACTN